MTEKYSGHDPELSRRYCTAGTETPPPALDATILAAAREQAAQARRPRLSRWHQWMVPMGVAATMVIGVSLTLLVEREHPEVIDATRPPASAAAPAETPDSKKTVARTVPTVPAAKPSGEKREAGVTEAASARNAAPLQPLPQPFPAPAPAPASGSEREAPAKSEAVRDVDAGNTLDKFELKVEQGALMKRKEADSRRAAAGALGGATAESRLASPIKAAPAAEVPARLRAEVQPSAEAWLERIRQLKRSGNDAEAVTQMAAFRKAYPGAAVPDDLRDLVRPEN